VVDSAQKITESDLSKRLPVSHPKDKIGRLTTTINGLLARLETAFARREDALSRQRRFAADAGHELRTPLTSISGYAQMLEEVASTTHTLPGRA
jgi:two-component system, OmpR family, sensor kinase